jgi:hypothetical protein
VVREVNEMRERSKRIYGVGKYKSRLPASAVIIWSLFAAGFWVLSIGIYVTKGRIDAISTAMACLFSIVLGVSAWSSKRTGLKV